LDHNRDLIGAANMFWFSIEGEKAKMKNTKTMGRRNSEESHII